MAIAIFLFSGRKWKTKAAALSHFKVMLAHFVDRKDHDDLVVLIENYGEAIIDLASNGVAERIRLMSGLTADGAELVNKAFSIQSPILVLGPLATESEKSEQ